MSEIISHSGSISGIVTNSDATNSTSTATGSLQLTGGLGVAKDIYCDNLFANNTPVNTVTGSVTQLTSLSTSVTLNAEAGVVNCFSTNSIVADDRANFTLNNTYITSSSVIVGSLSTGAANVSNASVRFRFQQNGSVIVHIMNVDSITLTDYDYRVHFHVIN